MLANSVASANLLRDSAMQSMDHLLSAAQAGDVSALNALVRTHQHGVYRYGLTVCRTTEDAEDAVQETIWAATRAIKSFRGSASSIVAWLFTIVRRECLRLIDRHRRAPVGLAGDEDSISSGELGPEDALETSEQGKALAAALADLEPAHREVLLLRDVQEWTAPEAAEHLGISVDALKSRLHRARAQLRARLCSSGDCEHSGKTRRR
jgi:RNA polymerase sigma-70 factor (ECF subfamily)